MINPVSNDKRYTIAKEYTGKDKPQWVLRYCGDWVCSSPFLSTVAIRAIGMSCERRGCQIIEEVQS